MKKILPLLLCFALSLGVLPLGAAAATINPVQDYEDDYEIDSWEPYVRNEYPAYGEPDENREIYSKGLNFPDKNPETVWEPVSPGTVVLAAKEAGQAARSAGEAVATVALTNAGAISKNTLREMVTATDSSHLSLQADSTSKGGVDVRLTLSPSLSIIDLHLGASTVSTEAVAAKDAFLKAYQNYSTVVRFGHRGEFGQLVEVAVKLRMVGVKLENLHFYSFDRTTGLCRELENTNAWLDANNYLHFNVTCGGDIVVTEGQLWAK